MKKLTKKKAIEFSRKVLGTSKVQSSNIGYVVVLGEMEYNFWLTFIKGVPVIYMQVACGCLVFHSFYFNFETLEIDDDLQDKYNKEIREEYVNDYLEHLA